MDDAIGPVMLLLGAAYIKIARAPLSRLRLCVQLAVIATICVLGASEVRIQIDVQLGQVVWVGGATIFASCGFTLLTEDVLPSFRARL